ncbi:MAG: bile acid:sodium symporter family protein [Myxococcales bacterium]|nr:bile acid:sodium symporter family protein [Myxococcales bacterium]
MDLDAVRLSFSDDSLVLLNIILGLIMFGVALDLTLEDFRRVARSPRSALLGLLSQFIVLPALTFGLTLLLQPPPSVALGMILVAACPGGNVSNFISHMAGGNTALSVSLTAVSTLGAMLMTPTNVVFWGGLNPQTAPLLQSLSLPYGELIVTVLTILGLPLVLGMYVASRFPGLQAWLRRPMRIFSMLALVGFIVGALAKNWAPFRDHVSSVVMVVAIHNAVALGAGWLTARLGGLGPRDRRTVAIETGIQNSGLGLVLIFSFFNGLGGMAIIAAWWGVWHLVGGLSLASLWSRWPVSDK